MRILFLDSKVEFLNPTRQLLVPLLEGVGNVTSFGPGYVSESVLETGVGAFAKHYGPFDAIAVTEHVTNAALWPLRNNIAAQYRRSQRRHFPISHLKFVPEILEFVLQSELPKVALALETDYYGIGMIEIETLLKFDLVVGFGEQFVKPLSNLQRYGLEAFAPLANDNYANMVRTHANRVLSFPHFVSSDEFVGQPGVRRQRPRVAVPGASYSAREAARKALANVDLLSPGARHLRKSFGALSHLGVPAYSSAAGQAILRWAFRLEVGTAAMAFTDGSGLEWPVRKFFEIPAMGSALLCLPCNGFEALGFMHGNSAVATTPETIVNDARELLAEPRRLSQIQQAGWSVVQQSHTLEARALALRQAMDMVLAGAFSGSWWDRGSIVLM